MDFKDKLKLLPSKPGCYLMKDKYNNIIYVGKAKNLKNRVNSYFVGSHNRKTTALVSNIVDFDYVITNSELEALILELNLIKEHDPKYNILFTDDKTYPHIVITNDAVPRMFIARDMKKIKGLKFGPYPDVKAARYTHRLISKLYPLRKCRSFQSKPCLYYHIKQCLAPCSNKIDREYYQDIIKDISKFLKGDTKDVLERLTEEMYSASKELNFEKAQELKETIDSVQITTKKQNIILDDNINRDVYGYYSDEDSVCIQVLYMRLGKIVATDSQTMYYYNSVEETVLKYIINKYKIDSLPIPKEILIDIENIELLSEALGCKILTPKRGEKKKILDLATSNAKENISLNKEILKRNEDKTLKASQDLGDILNLEKCEVIEAFDNSNLQGTSAVSAMVVFKNGYPSKRDYRKYKIKTVEGPDDYASMREVIYRRYFNVLITNSPRPDLIVVDGGKGQVSSAVEVLESLNMNIPVIGLKKNSKHKTEAIITATYQTIPLKQNSNIYKLLYNIQEEVHRFAINYHKKVRSSSFLNSELDNIKGVGHVSKGLIINNFSTLNDVKEANVEDFVAIGLTRTQSENIVNFFKK